MNTLNDEDWEDLEQALNLAVASLNSACEVLAKNHIDSKLGLQMEAATGEAHTQASNALYAAREEQKRLKKAADEEKV